MPETSSAFEIFYADGSIVAGKTATEFAAAPDAGVQFVIVRAADRSVCVQKGADEYVFDGATKPGAWTDRETYERIAASLRGRSKLLVAQDRSPRDRRFAELRRLRGY